MRYPDLKRCATASELVDVVTDCMRALDIPRNVPTWPGRWAHLAKVLRTDSCEFSGEAASDRLLMANILLDGEARYTEILRTERDNQDVATQDAYDWLVRWLDQVNASGEAQSLDALTSMSMSIEYARAGGDSRKPALVLRCVGMRTALRLVFGLWLVADGDSHKVMTGQELTATTGAKNHCEAATRLSAQRI